MARTPPPALLGLQVSGDIGGVTIYTDRHRRKIVYDKAPPTSPASPLQAVQRSRFAEAVRLYRNLSTSHRANLETVTQRAAFCLTGQNLWISACLQDGNANLQSLGRRFNLDLPDAPRL